MSFLRKTSAIPFYNKYYGIPILIFTLNLALKMAYLAAQDLSHDEPFTIYHAQFDVSRIIYFLKAYNNPPLYELILHYWIKLFGISAFCVRLLPCLFGALSAVVLFGLGSRFFSFSLGLTSSLLYTFSTMSVYYSHDCRVYTLFLLLTLLSVYLYLLSSQQPGRKLYLGLFVLTNACLIYAHYFGFIVLFIQFIHALVSNRPALRRLMGVNLVTLLLYIPQLFSIVQRFYTSASQGTWVKEPMGVESLYNMLWSFSNAPVVTVLCLCVLISALCFLIYRRSGISSQVMLLLIWFFVPFIGMFVISYKIPMYLDRYLIFVLPAYYLLLAHCVQYVFRKGTSRVIVSVLLIGAFACTANLNPDKKRRVSDMINYVKTQKDPHTLVVVCGWDFLPTFAYHYNPGIFRSIDQQSEYGLADSLLRKDQVIHLRALTDIDADIIKHYQKVIYVDAATDFSSLNSQALAVLQKYGKETSQVPFYSVFHVYQFDVSR